MIIDLESWRRDAGARGMVLLAAVMSLVAVMLLMAECERQKPEPYNPSRTGTIWRLAGRPAPSSIVRKNHGGTYYTSGDSIMAATYLPIEQRTALLLAAKVCGALCGQPGQPDVRDVSRGGQRLIDGDGHNLIDDWAGELASVPHPTTIVLLIGTDDLYGSPSADWEAAYLQLRDQALASGTRLMPCLITPLVQNERMLYLREAQREDLNAWLRRAFGPGNYVDTEAVLATPGGIGLNPIYDSGDGMHLTAAGVAVLANAIYDRI